MKTEMYRFFLDKFHFLKRILCDAHFVAHAFITHISRYAHALITLTLTSRHQEAPGSFFLYKNVSQGLTPKSAVKTALELPLCRKNPQMKSAIFALIAKEKTLFLFNLIGMYTAPTVVVCF